MSRFDHKPHQPVIPECLYRESILLVNLWIPAFAGMTNKVVIASGAKQSVFSFNLSTSLPRGRGLG